MSKPINVDSGSFETEVISSPVPVVVDFWAAWCGPCRMMAPVLDQLASEYDGSVKFAKVNVDEHQDVAMSYNIMSIPTLVIFKDGQEVGRVVGYMPKDRLKAELQKKLA
ncbi:MAG: thioredoxin [Clostridia bacterium]|nr:thioredoxin [Clostridia bacterium]